MRTKLGSLITDKQQELSRYGGSSRATDTFQKGPFILSLLTKFANDFIASIDGTSSEMSTKELCGGARIYHIFNNVFKQALDVIPPCSNLSDHDIRTAIQNSTGPRPSLFVPELAFDLLVRPQIKLLEAPSLKCVEMVYEELMKLCHNSDTVELARYPRLYQKLSEVVSELLRERLGPTVTYIESLISIERAYINTNHPDFMGAAGAMANLEQEAKKKKKTEAVKRRQLIEMKQRSEHVSVEPGHEENTSKESLLNYFFGGGTHKSEKSTVGLQEMMTKAQYAPFMSVNNMMQNEVIKKFEQTSLNDDIITDREELETQLIRTLITSYFNIVKKNIQDLVPKSIMHLLVNHSREAVQNRLVSALYKQDRFDELLQEDESIAAEREKCEAMLNVYKQAFELIKNSM